MLLTYPTDSPEFAIEAYQNVYLYLGVGGATFIVNFIYHTCFQICCTRMISALKNNYIKAILRQDADWLDRNSKGELISKLNE